MPCHGCPCAWETLRTRLAWPAVPQTLVKLDVPRGELLRSEDGSNNIMIPLGWRDRVRTQTHNNMIFSWLNTK